jgi:hypothetical protein
MDDLPPPQSPPDSEPDPPASDADLILSRILANLVLKIEAGSVPTEREIRLLEAHKLLPPGWRSASPDTDAPSDPGQNQPTADSSPGPTPAQVKTIRPAEAADLYKTDIRTIRRWQKTGKTAGELPPLAHPDQMTGWWTRHYKHRVPQNILAAASAIAPAPAPPAAAPDSPATPPPAHLDNITGDGGFSDLLIRLRKREAIYSAMVDQAMATQQYDAAERYQKTHREIIQELRNSEKAAAQIAASQNDIIRLADLRAIAIPHLVSLQQNLRDLAVNLHPQIANGASLGEWDEAWNSQLDRLFEKITTTITQIQPNPNAA